MSEKNELICKHNQYNPYVDIQKYIREGLLPEVTYEPVTLEAFESIIYAAPIYTFIEGYFVADLLLTNQRCLICNPDIQQEIQLSDVILCKIINDETIEFRTKQLKIKMSTSSYIVPYIYH